MYRKYSFPLFIILTVLILILTDCRKDDEYEYFEDYTGSWQFRVYRRSWLHGVNAGQYDTIYYFGSINKLSDNRGLQINYLAGSSVYVWVENDTILFDAGEIGVIRDDEIHFGYTSGSMAIGTSDQVYGVKNNTNQYK